jgi:hypothetical protein
LTTRLQEILFNCNNPHPFFGKDRFFLQNRVYFLQNRLYLSLS